MDKFFSTARKALIGGLSSATAAFAASIADGNVSWADGGVILAAFIAGAYLVYQVPNAV